jgi:uncharacterized membrane protein YoaK (UPF0700 family)
MDHRPPAQVVTMIAIALTFCSGAMDVASFTRLGSVFASVMTGNIALWGLATARGSLTLATHTAVAIAGYVAGVAGGGRIAVALGGTGPLGGTGRSGDDKGGAWPAHITWALVTELVLLAGFAAGWEVTGARPGGWAQFCLLAVAAAAMGMQSSAVVHMGLTHVSTTYLTGTLTGLVSSLVSSGDTRDSPRRFGVLLGLVTGASLCGLFIATASAVVPALPLAALVFTVVMVVGPAAGPGSWLRRTRPRSWLRRSR